ncbi:ATP-binding cassette, subfamily B [Peptoclostridium litorale DSM 5388]|uniref:Putative ABC transporter ATP-binding protein n=1 Tax=Peptoclostridium litorale DSM 5388 TaxID=1121324 RepID=A0A069REC1_PEPLI|nr:ABC transporter ATP-binding protein [Peptoclostridium litorale]KDR94535.1 putative ABC transporter ATP-binding protein [Peptoclostridium litorale DSM 5388]SIO37168.1 ATP-binding cassette, subfamily B [Peptoclostridium litorale DSM 5388]
MDKDMREERASQRSGRGPGGHISKMGMPVEKAKDFRGTLKRLLEYLGPQKLAIGISCLAAGIGTIFNVVGPKIMAGATDSIYITFTKRLNGINAPIEYGYIKDILLLLVALYLISAAFGYAMQYIMAGVSQKTVYSMRKRVSEKLSRLPLGYYDAHGYGDVMSRVSNDIDNISSTLHQSISHMLTSIITISGIVGMMISISPALTLVTIVTLPLSAIVTRSVAKRSQKLFKEQQKVLGKLNSHVEEMYSGHNIVKAFGYEKKSMGKFDDLNIRLYESGYRAQFISSLIMPLINFIGNIGYVLICAVGAIFVSMGSISIGGIQAFIQYSRQFSHPIVRIASIANTIQSTIASAERVFELLDEDEESPDGEYELNKESVIGDFMFENVKFSYKEGEPLIENLNISVKPGQTAAIVGPTGAGKTTLVNLIMRFYEVGSGRIMLDGMDVRDISRESLRRSFGMVLQDTWLFGGSIRDNIGYGRLGATDDEITQAAKAAYADHFIMTLPNGYDTVINEEADNISQGQKQLLTIARAMIANPRVLILDEATSSVDTRTEKCIQKAAEKLMEGRTSFIIAHRLSTIVDADVILVMDKGNIIEYGTHEDLMLKRGFYFELYSSQFTAGNME